MTKNLKKFLAILLAMSMTLGMLTIGASAAEDRTYADVFDGDWYEDAVAYVTEKGYMNGVDVDLFAPLEGTTRAMVVTVLYRMETEPAEVEAAGFPDLDPVNGFWYVDAVNWATANQIARGYEDGTFRPSNIVTREELATFFYRWAQYKNYNVSLVADLSGYADNGDIQDYAKEAMAWAVAVGLIQGVTENTLCPVTYAKRAETAMMLYRLTGDPKVVAAITSTEDLDDPDTPMAETPDTPYIPPYNPHTHSYTYGDWTPTEDGTQHTRTGTCSCGQTNVQTEDHTYNDGVCVCGAVAAPGVTAKAVEALNAKLVEIKGNNDQPLVTAVLTGNELAVTLDTDAIKGSGESFSNDLLNGLMTNIKKALDETFGDYKLSVNNNEVYASGTFNNTALKAAIYDVAGGFFFTLANMEPAADGVYTYKTVKANVDNQAGNADKYAFDLAIQLKGDDVAKVKNMASILEKHLSMGKMTADKAAEYGITGENEYILVGMEMPDAIMNTLKGIMTDKNIVLDTETITNTFNGVPVGTIISYMGQASVDQLVGSGVQEIGTLLNMLNGNANLVNKVLDHVPTVNVTTLKNETTEATTVALLDTSVGYHPDAGTAAWQAAVAEILKMMAPVEGKAVTPGQFQIKQDYYLVPITVGIDLGETFQGTETVLFELHIPLSKLATEPAPKTDVQVTEEAVKKVQEVLKGYTGHGDAQLVTLTENTEGGYDLALDVSAVQAGAGITNGAGLATAIGNAMKETFTGRTLSVNGNTVYSAEGTFNNTALKDALFSVAEGFFYRLANMGDDNIYKTVTAKVGEHEFAVNVKLSGDDVARVKTLASKLEKYLSMNTMDASTVKTEYGYEGNETSYIVVGVEMPKAVQDFLAENKNLTAETFNAIPVMTAINGLAHYDVPSLLLPAHAANINPVIATVNGNADLVNTVLRHATITVKDQTLRNTFTPGTNEASDWQNFMAGVLGMVNGLDFGDIGDYAVTGQDGIYVVPVTVDIDLQNAMGFTANETVLVVLNIPFETNEIGE